MAAKIAILILRLGFGGLFFYSGISKLRSPLLFLEEVRGFRIFDHINSLTGLEIDPSPWEAWMSMGLPWLELFCGSCILIGVLQRGALVILNGALVVFTIAIMSAWSRGLDISCGCFGESTPISDYRLTILQRLLFLAAGVTLLILTIRQSGRNPVAPATENQPI